MTKLAHLRFNDPAPDLVLPDTEGQPIRLSALWRHNPLVLGFTRHFGCPQCKDMIDRLVEAAPQLEERGMGIALVTHSSVEAARDFCRQHAPGMLCLADADRTAYRAYGLGRGGWRETFLSRRVWRSNRDLFKRKRYRTERPPAGQDAYQMGGTFIIGTDGRIRLPYYYDDIADHPPVDLLLHGLLGMQWSEPLEIPLHE
jgi:peroxiredoxin